MRFAFFGSSKFAQIVLQELLQKNWQPVLIVTNPARPKGRKHILSPTPVEQTARKYNIPVLTPLNLKTESFQEALRQYHLDICILTAYGKIVPEEILLIPTRGFVNIHPSLLPKYRGATPIQSTILSGDTETGITLLLMDKEIDHGPVIQKTEYKIENTRMTYSDLTQELAHLGAELAIQALPLWLKGEVVPQPQDESLATYCSKITFADEKINWDVPSTTVDRKVRSLSSRPLAYFPVQDKIFKIGQGQPYSGDVDLGNKNIGEVFSQNDQLIVKCKEGAYWIEMIQPAGKNMMKGADFLRGNKWILEKY